MQSNKKVDEFRKVMTKVTTERKDTYNVLWADPKASPQVSQQICIILTFSYPKMRRTQETRKAADGDLPRAQVPKYFGLEDSDLPAIAIHEGANDGKYFFKNAAVKKVEKWLDDFEVRSYVLSEKSSHTTPSLLQVDT